MEKVVLIGGGGYCSGIIDSIEAAEKYEIIGITDPSTKIGSKLCGYTILGDDSILENIYESGVKNAHITVGSVGTFELRKKLICKARKIGFKLITVIDPSAIISKYVSLGEMLYIGKGAILNSNVSIGDFSMINTACVVEHGCKIGSLCHVAPCAALAGDIQVENESHIGINATVLQGVHIGNNCIIGAGSVVLADVESNQTVYGVVKRRSNPCIK